MQLLASFGQTLVQPRDDDSHRAMTWETSRRAFRSETSDDGFQTLLVVPGRCWPHHLDLATLLTFPASAAPDETCHVNGWPSPDTNLLPTLLGAGHWNTEGWVGAVLPADAVVAMRYVVLAGRRAP